MQPLFLCWIFDKRWLWGFSNPCMQFLLLIPLCLDAGTIVAILVQRSFILAEIQPIIITLIALYGLLSLLCLILMVRTYNRSQNKMVEVSQNSQAIRQFTHQFEIKRGVWSWIGFLVTLFSVGQIILNSIYIKKNSSIYNCFANKIRFWMDIGSWGYIGLVLLTFLICKLCFLLISWRHPQKYLRFKQII